ncbi:cytochrome C [Blastomonas sp.]|uniref:SorB family sulfite dehydrogenase c-type cytochrome subunit n=1 Tax=Blastomonas sp. TaxID=1909299 RepID=UPI002632555A|nr:cytochrome C [Blastomonas sp.]MDM7955233.1 cytochrome C [Blastomonas sp.]
MGSGQQTFVTAFIVVSALAVLAVFPGVHGEDRVVPPSSLAPVSFVMPEETTPPELADEGAELVVSTCSACHSLEYITTQPRGMGEKFWHDSVGKMVKVYGAPIEPADAQAISDILADRFG